jgi:eukaryotic-like serine/threonine-protein kinase
MNASSHFSSSSQFVPGTVCANRYTLHRILGAGGTGVVYHATCQVTEREVALKVVHRHLISNTQVMKRFEREARILSELSGDHLVAVIDFGTDEEGRMYMALEYVEGIPLDSYMLHHSPVAVEDSVRIVRELCCALKSAHEHGIVHRDLKPANVLLEIIDQQPHRVRVVDFGMAKILRDAALGTSALTEQNMIFGTPEYMAPEQVRGDIPDERCDIYAAGVMLYELLTGKQPFVEMTNVATMTAHLSKPVPPPTTRAPERNISPALEAVVLHSMAKNPDERYPSAEAMADALTFACQSPHDTVSTRPPPKIADISIQDTDLDLQTPRKSRVDPLGKTQQPFKSSVSTTLNSVKIAINESPGAESSKRREVTIQVVQPVAPKPWVWIMVALVAMVIGVGLGIVIASQG